MLRFRFRGLRFRVCGCFVFEFWLLRFRSRVLRFRDLGSSFSRFGGFVFQIWVLRASVFVFECFVFETTEPTDCPWVSEDDDISTTLKSKIKPQWWISFGFASKKWIPFITYAGFPQQKVDSLHYVCRIRSR